MSANRCLFKSHFKSQNFDKILISCKSHIHNLGTSAVYLLFPLYKPVQFAGTISFSCSSAPFCPFSCPIYMSSRESSPFSRQASESSDCEGSQDSDGSEPGPNLNPLSKPEPLPPTSPLPSLQETAASTLTPDLGQLCAGSSPKKAKIAILQVGAICPTQFTC